MTERPMLDRLVDLAGIEPEYWDIWGNHHPVSADGKRRILAALGLPAESNTAIGKSLQKLEAEQWRRPLPPVVVIREGQPIAVPLVLPAAGAAPPVLRVTAEEGATHDIAVSLAELRPEARGLVDGAEYHRFTVPLGLALPTGYHEVRLAGSDQPASRLIVAPASCYLPAALSGDNRVWGLSTQLYALRRAGNWGIGDFTDLNELIDAAGRLGAAVVGVNPLHALFLDHPAKASPYSPASRLFLNPLYIDVEAVPEFADCREVQTAMPNWASEITTCWSSPWVDYERVASLKLQALSMLYGRFAQDARGRGAKSARAQAFKRFCAEGGEPLKRFALFQALAEYFRGEAWQDWPEAYRHPDSPTVQAFADRNAARVDFFRYLQWLCDEQLAAAAARSKAAGLAVGLYRDLAVGGARESADAWSDQDLLVQTAKVGCPPDPFNMLGQDWQIPPIHPLVLRERAYAPFVELVRANMRHAGALRIDHVMALLHLFWIPGDGTPAGGAYVKYPFEDLLGVLALESHRNQCVVVGEDLGTVPDGFRERMVTENILSYRVLYFEKGDDRYKAPQEFPESALACVTTHDLATLWGYWRGADLALKKQLALYPTPAAAEEEYAARVHDRYLLLKALQAENLLPRGRDPNNVDGAAMDAALAAALHAYLARSPSKILLVQLDDLTEEMEQINLPGTIDERPNWRRKLSKPVDALPTLPTMRALKPGLAGRMGGAQATKATA
jgi:4-alpha-glucanotransferase